MNLIEKIKLLFKIKEPAQDLANQLKGVKRGYKTVSFWVTFLGTLLSLVGALQGIIPATTAVLITTALTTVYNILRGLLKAEADGVRPPMQATEFWVGLLGILSSGLIQAQTAGVSGRWLTVAMAVVAGGMAAAQNLGAQAPIEKSK